MKNTKTNQLKYIGTLSKAIKWYDVTLKLKLTTLYEIKLNNPVA